MSERTEVEKQIEAAFDYRGHVTITFVNGETLVGFIFNRAFSTPKHPVEPFIEVYPKGSDAAKKFLMSEVRSVALTGEDAAAGNSYEDYLKKKKCAA